jgi:hypothetical protein
MQKHSIILDFKFTEGMVITDHAFFHLKGGDGLQNMTINSRIAPNEKPINTN